MSPPLIGKFRSPVQPKPNISRTSNTQLPILRMLWNHEPTPNPSWEGNPRSADDCLLPSWEGPGVGRFRESLLSLLRMHWDHEPRGGGRRRASVLDCGSPLPLLRPRTRSESARGLAHSKTWRYGGRFTESGEVILVGARHVVAPRAAPA